MGNRASATIVALILALASVANAQVSNTGTIVVTVSDRDGGRLPGVTVTASAPDTITKRTTVTDAEGVASLEALAPSTQYILTVELTGFQTLERSQILVRAGQTASIPLTLQLAGIQQFTTNDAIVTSRLVRQGQTDPLNCVVNDGFTSRLQ